MSNTDGEPPYSDEFGPLIEGDWPDIDDPEFGLHRLENDPVAWLEQSRLRDEERSPWYDRGRYPARGTVRDFYLNPANKLANKDLRDVLRALLPTGTGVVTSDRRILDANFGSIADRLTSGEATEYERRLFRAILGRGIERHSHERRTSFPAAPIPDLTWIIDLVFDHPAQAFEVAQAYLAAHGWILNDQVIDGIFDFMVTVRCHFGLDSPSQDIDIALLRSLPSRSLEYLVAALWGRMGYKTSVTKSTRDGGRDVIARREGAGRSETVLIECRQWDKHISVTAPRELIGVMQYERANKGIIVAPGGFAEGTGSATEFATDMKTVELINGAQLAALMTERCGPRWPIDIARFIQDGRRIAEIGEQGPADSVRSSGSNMPLVSAGRSVCTATVNRHDLAPVTQQGDCPADGYTRHSVLVSEF